MRLYRCMSSWCFSRWYDYVVSHLPIKSCSRIIFLGRTAYTRFYTFVSLDSNALKYFHLSRIEYGTSFRRKMKEINWPNALFSIEFFSGFHDCYEAITMRTTENTFCVHIDGCDFILWWLRKAKSSLQFLFISQILSAKKNRNISDGKKPHLTTILSNSFNNFHFHSKYKKSLVRLARQLKWTLKRADFINTLLNESLSTPKIGISIVITV